MTRIRPEASLAEIDVLKVLWSRGPSTVREVGGQLRRRKRTWAYNTILTFLRRLKVKGYVATEAEGAAFRFRAVVSQDELIRQRLREIARDLADNSLATLAQALVSDPGLAPTDRRQLRKIFSRLPAHARTAPGSKRRSRKKTQTRA